ncbi:unnamed protein product [Spirodela intermedia]|uniref:Uncharacterized protein n=1 Tax=Spirodela intermedia TaxID=51605 RepID=A0A7I8LJ66_SPIIN|nr:unnamed protein product [Spirodela intermedia]
MGKERKYTGLTKHRLIEHLLRIVSQKEPAENEPVPAPSSSPAPAPAPPSKRQRKNGRPSRLRVETGGGEVDGEHRFCRNLACQAAMGVGEAFCKRCSCCICHKYDENKDPSLWLVCGGSEDLSREGSCAMSCHLECALRHKKSGMADSGPAPKLDGAFYCVSCGKVNDLLGCWKKQLAVARDARRVDILCYRVSLAHKFLRGTERFQSLHSFVDAAMKKLEQEVGALDGLPVRMARGIVNRLSSGAEVQRLCADAISLLGSILPRPPQVEVLFLQAAATTAGEEGGSPESETRSPKSSDPLVLSEGDESDNTAPYGDPGKLSENGGDGLAGGGGEEEEEEPSSTIQTDSHKDSSNSTDLNQPAGGKEAAAAAAVLPMTPSKVESSKDAGGGVEELLRGKKVVGARREELRGKVMEEEKEGSYEYCVKVIRWLECDGHIESSFRVKFLTWFSLRATAAERRVVRVFVDAMADDPSSLAGQLVDTFSEAICRKPPPLPLSGFCTRLWH